jgi:hypothetical protein
MLDSEAGLTSLDRLTRSAAMAVSRRTMLKGGLSGVGAVLGLGLFNWKLVEANCGTCNTCYGPCTKGTSTIQSCCSPNGYYCYFYQCLGCGCAQAKFQICDCNNYTDSCPACCFLCFFGCPC